MDLEMFNYYAKIYFYLSGSQVDFQHKTTCCFLLKQFLINFIGNAEEYLSQNPQANLQFPSPPPPGFDIFLNAFQNSLLSGPLDLVSLYNNIHFQPDVGNMIMDPNLNMEQVNVIEVPVATVANMTDLERMDLVRAKNLNLPLQVEVPEIELFSYAPDALSVLYGNDIWGFVRTANWGTQKGRVVRAGVSGAKVGFWKLDRGVTHVEGVQPGPPVHQTAGTKRKLRFISGPMGTRQPTTWKIDEYTWNDNEYWIALPKLNKAQRSCMGDNQMNGQQITFHGEADEARTEKVLVESSVCLHKSKEMGFYFVCRCLEEALYLTAATL